MTSAFKRDKTKLGEGGYEKHEARFFTAENKLHNVFHNSETACHREASFMTCSIFSLNNVEAGTWDKTLALNKHWNL